MLETVSEYINRYNMQQKLIREIKRNFDFIPRLLCNSTKCDLISSIITPVEEKANPSAARVVRTMGLSALQPRSENGGKRAKVQCTIFLRVSPSSTAPAGYQEKKIL
ncbi:hypothetical protein G5I_13516 [Acromyrmex echinatior]|uniref:Uncharacterized protein n=1 Tax=Acromyrmex echinatior TaxID=103372 RepID=F4X591_ACREC|nr:hypothetical protein G5I_13516 [Acromyrmex echinatior]